jgi:hypothetical protein
MIPSCFELMKQYLYTPVVGDILDQYGCFHQFLPLRCDRFFPP